MCVRACISVFPAEVKLVLVVKEEVSSEQQDQQHQQHQQDPEPPHIKQEQEVWSNQDGEQLQAPKTFPFTSVPVSTESGATQLLIYFQRYTMYCVLKDVYYCSIFIFHYAVSSTHLLN